MIRVVLGVALAAAIFGIAVPSAEAVDRDRSAALALSELEALNETAERLAAENDPVDPGNGPAATTVTLEPPDPTFVDPGRIRIAEGGPGWESPTGPNRTLDPAVPIRVDTPIVVTDRTRLRLSFVSLGGDPVVRIEVERARV